MQYSPSATEDSKNLWRSFTNIIARADMIDQLGNYGPNHWAIVSTPGYIRILLMLISRFQLFICMHNKTMFLPQVGDAGSQENGYCSGSYRH